MQGGSFFVIFLIAIRYKKPKDFLYENSFGFLAENIIKNII